MSNYKRALKTLNLEFTDRITHWEYISNPDFVTELTGIDAYEHPQKARLRTLELLDWDVVWRVPMTDEPSDIQFKNGESVKANKRGEKVVRWGAGATWSWDHSSMFKSIEDIRKFDPISFFLEGNQKIIFEDMDPIQRWFSLSLEDLANKLDSYQRKVQNIVGSRAVYPAFYYRTLLMWPLMLFGWERTAELAYCYKEDFKRIFSGFAEISKKVMKAFAMTDIIAIVSHDDICMTSGPIFNPKWYRENLYGYYEEIWEPLKEAGKKIIFVSDGKLDEVIDDLVAAGIDGIIVETFTDLNKVAKKYKNRLIMVGNMDSRILLMGGKDDIKKEVDRCTAFGIDCPGYFYGVTNHITWNIPVENVKFYFEYCKEKGVRK